MPGKVKVKIISGRNLPVMDRSSDTTDAYVEIKLGSTTFKTDVCRKSLHPHWNSEWYKFEVDDSELQDEPLQIRLMDHDTYSANDAIGKVYLDLNPLLLPSALVKFGSDSNHEPSTNAMMSGWIPVYDTMHGIRGEVNIIVKVELFSDFNRFRQSSCGIQFFCSKSIPHGYIAQNVHGFVEELIVNDDPEYQWIDKIRTPRASNEARQTLFFKLSGELQRKIGLKALDLGGNAVIGYCQCFDLEGESGIVARGIGTAVTLVKLIDIPHSNISELSNDERADNYLKFLNTQAGFHLNPSPYFKPAHPFLTPSASPILATLDISTNRRYKYLPKHCTELQRLRSSQSNPSLNDNIHHASVKTLLRQEDMRGRPSSGLGQKFKNFRYSSQNILSKKMIALKAKLGDSGIGEENDDEEAVQKKRRQFKSSRAATESSVMAELLARSVIHAHNSLTCILESQDNKEDSSESESEPVTPEPNEIMVKTKSEPLLAVDMQVLETVSSVRSSSSSSSSNSLSTDDEEDSGSNFKDESNFETLSNVVRNVEMIEQNYVMKKNFSKQLSLPAIPFDDEAEEGNPFIFPDLSQEDAEEDEKDEKEPSEDEYESNDNDDFKENDSPSNYLEKPNAPIAKLESSDEELRKASPSNDDFSEMKKDPKTIIPPVMIGADIKRKSLISTAMQTILLDKVNIIGTYTPPMSPTTKSNCFSIESPISASSTSSIAKSPISPLSTPSLVLNNGPFPRSKTALSLDEWGRTRQRDTVLGAPFVSMNIRRQQSHPCFSQYFPQATTPQPQCASDSQLNKLTNEESIKRNKRSFINLLSRGRLQEEFDAKKLEKTASHEHLHKRKFSFLHLSRRKSHEPSSNTKNDNEFAENTKKRFSFLRRRRNKSMSDKEGIKKHGLLGTALGNVVMETVQDILATSHQTKNDPNPNSPPAPSALTTNNDNNNKLSDDTLLPNINTEIDAAVCVSDNNMHASLNPSLRNPSPVPDVQHPSEQGHHRAESIGTKLVQSPAKLNSVPCIYRRSSDSDLSITPKGFFRKRNSLTGSDRSCGMNGYNFKSNMLLRSTNPQDFDMLEYPFLTMSKFPSGFILQIGGAVSARSVKLLERISNFEEPESRDTWWSEIRMEIRSHTRALNCNAVLGYTETTSICEDICVLSASGTAAIIGFNADLSDKAHISKDGGEEKDKMPKIQEIKNNAITDSPDHDLSSTITLNLCALCHLPYNSKNVHTRATVLKCATCRTGKVPDVLIATIEAPDGTPILGRGCFIQSFVCRPLKDLRGESNAKEISDGLPFLEYELHRSLINKLKIKGMNAIFGLKVRISIGDKMLVGLATGTAMFLTPLPTPVLPKLVSDRTVDEKKLADLQKLLNDTVRKNREIYQLKNLEDGTFNGKVLSDDDLSEDEQTSIDLSLGNKDCCILEVDDAQDAELVKMLKEDRPPDGFHVVNTEFVPGLEELEIVKNLQMFTQVYRAKFQHSHNFDAHFQRLLQSVYFKLRRMVPCALCDLQFRVDLPENDEIQLCILGMALGLGDPQKFRGSKRKNVNANAKRVDDDLIFNLEEDQIPEHSTTSQTQTNYSHLSTVHNRSRQKSPLRNRMQAIKQRHVPYKERHGVDITPLSYVPGGKIEHYLGNLNFFFIRETTSIREEGGLSGFIHSFVTEVLAIVRAHVTALGGNAMVAYFMTECVLNHNLHKNQGQCLINVGGDVVVVSYYKEDCI